MNGTEIDYSKLNTVDWDVDKFQETVDESMQGAFCRGEGVSHETFYMHFM